MKINNILITSLQNFLSSLQQIENNYVIISEKNIYQHYPNIFKKIESTIVLDINEHNKSLSTTETIWKFLLEKNITKSHQIFIIGGGVLHDVAMFACSVFKRGLNIISVPTTLLAMVDAAIGGKNGINYLHYKNIIGDIYLPQQNIIIHDFLNTLPNEQLLSGWAEILKIALVSDKAFYHQCIQHLEKSILPNLDIIQYAIQLKTNIIQDDLYDNNKRQLLNFGHSIAHAIEGYFEDQNIYIPHGYAVILGILIENAIAEKLNLLHTSIKNKIEQDLKKYYSYESYPITADVIPILLSKIQQDKKNTTTALRFTLIEDIGKGKTKVEVSTQLIEEVLKGILSE
jgi:3-dehydroquinate synthase